MARRVEVQIVGDATSLKKALGSSAAATQTFGQKLQKTGKSISSVGKTLTRDLTLPIVGIGVVAGKMALDFDTAMTHVQALTGASAKQTKAWSDQILKVAPQLGTAPTDFANALYFVASAGVKVNQVMPITTAAVKAAASGMGDAQTVAQLLTSAINAYGASNLSATQATDDLTQAIKIGKAEPADFAASMGRVIPIAQNLGVTFHETAGLVAELTNTGLSADEAVTAVRATMASLIKPTAAATKELKTVGLSFEDLQKSVKQKGLFATLQGLVDKFHGNRTALAKLFPNIRALTGVLALTGKNAGNVSAGLQKMANDTGAAAKAFATARQSPGFKLQADLAQLKVTAIQLGNALIPAFTRVAQSVAGMAASFSNLSPDVQTAIIATAGILAILGPLTTAIGATTVAVGFLSSAFVALAAGELLAAGPITLIVAGLAAVAVGLVIAYKRSATFRAVVSNAINFVKSNWQSLVGIIPIIGPAILAVVNHFQTLRAIGAAVFHAIAAVIRVVVGVISTIVQAIGRIHWGPIGTAARIAFNIAKAAVRTLIDPIDAVISVVQRLWSILQTAISGVKSLASLISSLPSIPNLSLGSGTVTSSPTGGPRGGGRGGHGHTTADVVHVHLNLNGREIASQLVSLDKNYRRQNTGRPLLSGR